MKRTRDVEPAPQQPAALTGRFPPGQSDWQSAEDWKPGSLEAGRTQSSRQMSTVLSICVSDSNCRKIRDP